MKVKKLRIEHITFSTMSILKRPVDVFFGMNFKKVQLILPTYMVQQNFKKRHEQRTVQGDCLFVPEVLG